MMLWKFVKKYDIIKQVIALQSKNAILAGKEGRMASFTKKAIVASFLKLCAKKQPDKITVRDIVDDCEINRNTFYYYFQDIYALIDEVFGILCADFVASCQENGDVTEGLCSLT